MLHIGTVLDCDVEQEVILFLYNFFFFSFFFLLRGCVWLVATRSSTVTLLPDNVSFTNIICKVTCRKVGTIFFSLTSGVSTLFSRDVK